MLDAKTTANGYERFGTLARVPLAGGSPRPLLENVRYADWGPDGRDLMVERVVAGKHRIEFPVGKVLYESATRLDSPRVSRRAMPWRLRAGRGRGHLDPHRGSRGKGEDSGSLKDWWNLAWLPGGQEIVFAAPEPDASQWVTSVQAVSLAGEKRLLLRFPGPSRSMTSRGTGASCSPRGTSVSDFRFDRWRKGREGALVLDGAEPVDLSADGKTLLINEQGEGGGKNGSIYIRGTQGAPRP